MAVGSLSRADLRRIAVTIADALGIDVNKASTVTISATGIIVVETDQVDETAGVTTVTRVERTFRVLDATKSV